MTKAENGFTERGVEYVKSDGSVLVPRFEMARIAIEKMEQLHRDKKESAEAEKDPESGLKSRLLAKYEQDDAEDKAAVPLYQQLFNELSELGYEFDAKGSSYSYGRKVLATDLMSAITSEEVAACVKKYYMKEDLLEALTALHNEMETIQLPLVVADLEKMRAQKEVAELLSTRRALMIFDAEQLGSQQTKDRLNTTTGDLKKQAQLAHTNATRYGGYRLLPDLTKPLEVLSNMDESFANFREVTAELVDSLTLAQFQKPEGFRVRPLLLNGAPGVGKTAFGMFVGETLGIPFQKLSAAGLQNGFVLCGSAKHWGNSAPGLVFDLLARDKYATGVLLIDEVDKMPMDERYNALAALLDLLEPESARRYKDESVDIVFDASRLIILMTSNSVDDIDQALLSRCSVVEVQEPSPAQRLAIVRKTFDRLNADLDGDKALSLDEDAAEKLAKSVMGLRDLTTAVRKAFVLALREGGVVTPLPGGQPKRDASGAYQGTGVGFLAPQVGNN